MGVETTRWEVIIEKQSIYQSQHTLYESIISKEEQNGKHRSEMIKLSIPSNKNKTDIFCFLMWNSGKNADYLCSFLKIFHLNLSMQE